MKIVAISDMSVDEAREYTGHLVYIMRYKPSGKYYIGHSVDFGTRYVTIQRDNWFRDKYAIEDFEFKFVECVAEDAKDIADHFIDKYDSINDGLNFGYAQTFYTRTKRTKKEIAADQAKSDTESVIENDAEVAEDSKPRTTCHYH